MRSDLLWHKFCFQHLSPLGSYPQREGQHGEQSNPAVNHWGTQLLRSIDTDPVLNFVAESPACKQQSASLGSLSPANGRQGDIATCSFHFKGSERKSGSEPRTVDPRSDTAPMVAVVLAPKHPPTDFRKTLKQTQTMISKSKERTYCPPVANDLLPNELPCAIGFEPLLPFANLEAFEVKSIKHDTLRWKKNDLNVQTQSNTIFMFKGLAVANFTRNSVMTRPGTIRPWGGIWQTKTIRLNWIDTAKNKDRCSTLQIVADSRHR